MRVAFVTILVGIALVVAPGIPDAVEHAATRASSWSCPCSLRAPGTTSGWATSLEQAPVEVGVRFHSEVDGVVSAIRFLTAPGNDGPHVVNLWSATGDRLATAPAVVERGSGWQEVELATPVAVRANTDYVASYYAGKGHVADAPGTYRDAAVRRGPLTATAGVVHAGGASGFPSSVSPTRSDYGVDVVLQAGSGGPPPAAGGPVLVLSSPASTFHAYYPEILRAEGINELTDRPVDDLTPALLASYDVVLLAAPALTDGQVAVLSRWVADGGRLVAFRPDHRLAGLLGLRPTGAVVDDGHLRVDTSTAPGAGITALPMQFHGPADRYALAGATAVATLSSQDPAVTVHDVGTQGGKAAAFTYDLATSVVTTRQGNPAWAGQNRDGDLVVRADDLFRGGGGEADWVDPSTIAVAQADEQQRLLVNLLEAWTADRRPLPRLWYLPNGARAAVLLTGDDHGNGGTAGRFDQLLAQSPRGCVVDEWQCLRATSYVYADTPMSDSDAARYEQQGFEVALHVRAGCADWDRSSLARAYTAELQTWHAKYPSLGGPVSNRTHCTTWTDWASQPRVERANGIRLDTTYYFYPSSWVADRPALFTGSGIPMRFADTNGTVLDVYQAPTQISDESDQTEPRTIDTLLDRATGPEGQYAVVTVNMHTDRPTSAGADAVVASAIAHHVPVVSAKQVVDWFDGRAASTFTDLTWRGSDLVFRMTADARAHGLGGMLPLQTSKGTVMAITRDGAPVPFRVEVVKGVSYATFDATSGAYTATYSSASEPSVSGRPPAVPPAPAGTVVGDTTAADFARGTLDGGTRVTRLDDGEVSLAPTRTEANTNQAAAPPMSLRADVTLAAPGDRVGLASADGADSLTFDVTGAGPQATVVATVRTKGRVTAQSALGRGTVGMPHVYEIDYGRGYAGFSIDENLMVEGHPTFAGALRTVVAGADGRPAPPIRWVEASPYARRGTYTSRVLDGGASGTWITADWQLRVPQGSEARVSIRTGSTPTPGAGWTSWTTLPAADARVDRTDRYLQYRVDLGTEAADRSRTPRLLSMELTRR